MRTTNKIASCYEVNIMLRSDKQTRTAEKIASRHELNNILRSDEQLRAIRYIKHCMIGEKLTKFNITIVHRIMIRFVSKVKYTYLANNDIPCVIPRMKAFNYYKLQLSSFVAKLATCT